MRRSAVACALVLALAGEAAAEEQPPKPEPPRGYFGVSARLFVFVAEIAVHGGYRPLRDLDILWVHAEVVAGDDFMGDFLRYKYKGALAGAELRSPGRRLRGVLGFDVGAVRTQRYNEGDLEDTYLELAVSWHVAGELVLGDASIAFGLTSNAREPRMPMVALGLAVQF